MFFVQLVVFILTLTSNERKQESAMELATNLSSESGEYIRNIVSKTFILTCGLTDFCKR